VKSYFLVRPKPVQACFEQPKFEMSQNNAKNASEILIKRRCNQGLKRLGFFNEKVLVFLGF